MSSNKFEALASDSDEEGGVREKKVKSKMSWFLRDIIDFNRLIACGTVAKSPAASRDRIRLIRT